MPAPYSKDLRLRVMDAVRNGMAYKDVALRFRVSNSSILRWVRRLRETGSYAAYPMGGKKPFVLADEREWLLQRLAAKPDMTLRELLTDLHGRDIEVSYFALWHIVQRAGLRFKKDHPRERAGSTRRRAPSDRVASLAATVDRRQTLVFIDETWVKTNMTRLGDGASAASGYWPRCRTATGRR